MRLVILCLAASSSLLGVSLDDLMPIEVQRETGVIRLSSQQKQALANWLESRLAHQNVPPPPTNEDASQIELSLSENIQGGKILKLTDGSMWEVDPNDVSISRIWLLPFPVKIEEDHSNVEFPYKFINLTTGSSVNVKKL